MLKHFFHFRPCFGTSQNVLDTFSDTPELTDTLPETVLDTFCSFLKILYKAGVAHHSIHAYSVSFRFHSLRESRVPFELGEEGVAHEVHQGDGVTEIK